MQHCKVPGTAPTDELAIAAGDLNDAIRDISNYKIAAPFPIKIIETLLSEFNK